MICGTQYKMKVKSFSRDKEISTPSPWMTAPTLSGWETNNGLPSPPWEVLSIYMRVRLPTKLFTKPTKVLPARGRDSYIFTLAWNTTDHMPHLALALALNYSGSPVWKKGWGYPQGRWPVLSGRTVIFCYPVPSLMGFPGGSMVKSLPENAGDAGGTSSIPGSRRSPGEGNGNPLRYSCLGNPMDRGAWWAAVHGVPKGQKRVTDWAPRHVPSLPLVLSSKLTCSLSKGKISTYCLRVPILRWGRHG